MLSSPRALTTVSLTILAAVLVSACGPTTSTQKRTEITPYNESEFKTSKNGITVEYSDINSELVQTGLPTELKMRVQACDNQMQPMVDQNGKPVMENLGLVGFRHGEGIYKLKITNNTDHVIRLNRAVIRLFDPAGNQYEPSTVDELVATVQQNRPCPTTSQLIARLKTVKVLNNDIELVPGTSYTGYVFVPVDDLPTSRESFAGMWKLGLYEIPTKTNDAGEVIETTKFEFRHNNEVFVDTYRKDGPFASPVKVDSKPLN